jgi:hypothetical protein
VLGFIYLLVAITFLKLTYDTSKWTAQDEGDEKAAIHRGQSSFIAVLMVTLRFMPLDTRKKVMMAVFAIITIVFFVLFWRTF